MSDLDWYNTIRNPFVSVRQDKGMTQQASFVISNASSIRVDNGADDDLH